MLNKKLKDEALEEHRKATQGYDKLYEITLKEAGALCEERSKSMSLIKDIENLINSIANSPKEFEIKLKEIKCHREKFNSTEEFAKKAQQATIKSGSSAAMGATVGVLVKIFGEKGLMAVATTFGKASTGKAISSLSGAAAKKAALAWLGGGAKVAGGKGMTAGTSLIASTGPVGCILLVTSLVAGCSIISYKNHKVADKVSEEVKEIKKITEEMREKFIHIRNVLQETKSLKANTRVLYNKCREFFGADYENLSSDEQLQLGTLVNNTLSLAELLNKEVK